MMEEKIRILVADDEASLRGLLAEVLSEHGYEVTTVESGEEALKVFRAAPFPLVITDIRMGKISGIDLLEEVKRVSPETQVVIITSHSSFESAITALRAGAYDYLIKPFEDISLIATVANRAAEKIRLSRHNAELIEALKGKNQELHRLNLAFKDLAIRDGLTGLFNHRYFQECLAKELYRSKRHGGPVSLLFLDVDSFKAYNDAHGHVRGDQLLSVLAEILKKNLRATDTAARYGGEEFTVILPQTSREGAYALAEKIRSQVYEHAFEGSESQPSGRVTISVGIASFPEDAADGLSLVHQADQALYEAKQQGRNRVCLK